MEIIDDSRFGSWKIMLVFGILCFAIGLIAMLWTKMSLQVYIILLGIIAVAIGLMTLINMNDGFDTRNANIAKGALAIILGIVLMVVPMFVADIFAYLFAAFFIILGIGAIFGISAPMIDSRGRTVTLAFGLIMIVVGIIIAIFPNETVIVTTWVSGLILAILGAICIFGAWQVRKIETI